MILDKMGKWIGDLLFGGSRMKTTPFYRGFDWGNLGRLGNNAYQQLLSNYSPETYSEFYRNSFINPVKRTLQQDILPNIRQQFLGGDELGSSALNRALQESIIKAAQTLGQGMYSGYQNHQQNQMSALQQLFHSDVRKPMDHTGGLFHFGVPMAQEYIGKMLGLM